MNGHATRRALAVVCPLLALGAVAGCSLLAPAPPPPVRAVLDQLPVGVPRAPRRAGVLVVVVSSGAPLYDTTAIAYRTHNAEIGYFARHEWADRPSQMLQPLVLKTLQRTAAFTAVVAPPYFGHVPATLRIEIDRLLADFRPAVGALRFTLRAILRDHAGRLALRTVAVEQPIASQTPEAVVRAANDATAQALLQVSQFVVDPR